MAEKTLQEAEQKRMEVDRKGEKRVVERWKKDMRRTN